ncbi:hypothetical protein GCM10027431_09990 [Lysobacter rhizosphaerae]
MRELSLQEMEMVSAGTEAGAREALKICEGLPNSATVSVSATIKGNVTLSGGFVSGGQDSEVTKSFSANCGDLRSREGGGAGTGRAAGSTYTGVGAGSSGGTPTVTVGTPVRIN